MHCHSLQCIRSVRFLISYRWLKLMDGYHSSKMISMEYPSRGAIKRRKICSREIPEYLIEINSVAVNHRNHPWIYGKRGSIASSSAFQMNLSYLLRILWNLWKVWAAQRLSNSNVNDKFVRRGCSFTLGGLRGEYHHRNEAKNEENTRKINDAAMSWAMCHSTHQFIPKTVCESCCRRAFCTRGNRTRWVYLHHRQPLYHWARIHDFPIDQRHITSNWTMHVMLLHVRSTPNISLNKHDILASTERSPVYSGWEKVTIYSALVWPTGK